VATVCLSVNASAYHLAGPGVIAMSHAERAHAKYSASSAYRWMTCYGAVRACENAPPLPPTSYQLEGTAAHEFLERCLQNGCFDATFGMAMYGVDDAAVDRLVEQYKFDRDEVIEGIVDGVQTALDKVGEILNAWGDDAVLHIERPFQFPSKIAPDDTWGTSDIVIEIRSMGWLYVIDYKHGAGVAVDVKDNAQALYYGTGAVLGDGGFTDVTQVTLVIIQPRAFHKDGRVREETYDVARLHQFVVEVDEAITKCEDENAPLVPGRKQCQFCDARLSCPAREAMALSVASDNFKTVKDVAAAKLPDPKNLPVGRMSFILTMAPFLENWLQDVRNVAYAHMQAGGFVPGFKLCEAQARRRWHGENPEETAQALMRLAGIEDWEKVYPRKLITITQADKLVKDAFKAKVGRGHKNKAAEEAAVALAALTIKDSSGNLVLAPDTDKRPAVNMAAVTFASVKELPPPQTTKGIP
jgi:hypothetical protein